MYEVAQAIKQGDDEKLAHMIKVQSAYNEKLAKEQGAIAAASLAIPAAPTIGRTVWKVLQNPIVESYFTIDGLRNLASGNGVQKTVGHFKNGEY